MSRSEAIIRPAMAAISPLPLLILSLILAASPPAGAQTADTYKARLSPVPVGAGSIKDCARPSHRDPLEQNEGPASAPPLKMSCR